MKRKWSRSRDYLKAFQQLKGEAKKNNIKLIAVNQKAGGSTMTIKILLTERMAEKFPSMDKVFDI